MPVVYWEINTVNGETLSKFYEEVFAVNGESLSKFYEEVFEWATSVDDSGFHSFVSEDPEGINGGIFTGKGVLPTHKALYVEVDDIQEIVQRV